MKKILRAITKRIEGWRDKIAAAQRRRKRVRRKHRSADEISSKGLNFLVREEGIRLYAYNDPVGHCTVGVGHLLHLGNCTSADYKRWGSASNPGLTREQAIGLLKRDVGEEYGATVAHVIRKPMEQHEFDAMTSLCFNIGTGGFAESTVAREFNAGNKSRAADAFLLWNKPSMLIPRRHREIALFKRGDYGG